MIMSCLLPWVVLLTWHICNGVLYIFSHCSLTASQFCWCYACIHCCCCCTCDDVVLVMMLLVIFWNDPLALHYAGIMILQVPREALEFAGMLINFRSGKFGYSICFMIYCKGTNWSLLLLIRDGRKQPPPLCDTEVRVGCFWVLHYHTWGFSIIHDAGI